MRNYVKLLLSLYFLLICDISISQNKPDTVYFDNSKSKILFVRTHSDTNFQEIQYSFSKEGFLKRIVQIGKETDYYTMQVFLLDTLGCERIVYKEYFPREEIIVNHYNYYPNGSLKDISQFLYLDTRDTVDIYEFNNAINELEFIGTKLIVYDSIDIDCCRWPKGQPCGTWYNFSSDGTILRKEEYRIKKRN